MKDGECFKDVAFEFWEPVNKYMRDNHEFSGRTIIFNSLCMDFMAIMGFAAFNYEGESFRIFVAFAIFFYLR